MPFGKRGRPPEDRLARQREIYTAVAPLIMQGGARRLSMRQAAQAACLSVGGLYHYFPTKRDLVMHGLRADALLRYCEEFQGRSGHLSEADPLRYLEEGIEVIVAQALFCRPAIAAAVELGSESFWAVVETLLTSTALSFEVNLRRAAPSVPERDLQQCGRAIRRTICAALLDRSSGPDELRDELQILVAGFVSRARAGAPAAG